MKTPKSNKASNPKNQSKPQKHPNNNHKIKYPKFWAKIFFYEVVIAFIQNNLKECIQHMLNLIDYAKNNHDYTLEDKIDFFFVFLKGILKCGNITTTKKYELFKKEVDGMVVEIDDDFGDKKKMLTNRMKDIYKNFLSTKIRNTTGNLYCYTNPKDKLTNKLGKI